MGIQLRGWYCLLRFSVVRLRYTGSRPSRRMRRQSCSVTPQRMHRHRAPSLCRAECWAARTPPDLTGSELFRAGRKTPAGRGVGRAAEYSAERVPRYDQHAWAALTEPGLRSWWQQACGVHSERGEMQEVQGGGQRGCTCGRACGRAAPAALVQTGARRWRWPYAPSIVWS